MWKISSRRGNRGTGRWSSILQRGSSGLDRGPPLLEPSSSNPPMQQRLDARHKDGEDWVAMAAHCTEP
jgi:hypothetical protein